MMGRGHRAYRRLIVIHLVDETGATAWDEKGVTAWDDVRVHHAARDVSHAVGSHLTAMSGFSFLFYSESLTTCSVGGAVGTWNGVGPPWLRRRPDDADEREPSATGVPRSSSPRRHGPSGVRRRHRRRRRGVAAPRVRRDMIPRPAATSDRNGQGKSTDHTVMVIQSRKHSMRTAR